MRRPWLLPLLPLYAAGVAWKSRGFSAHPERAAKLVRPVISVGSLSAGGAGKTPFAIALGEALRRAGFDIDVLSRGHGRASAVDLRVNPLGDAAEFGDEPLLIARRLMCPVYVARERVRAGRMAEIDHRHGRSGRPLVHLLDDGFQHRQLARTVDVVLLTAEDARDRLLPVGNLREPLRALRRAAVVVLRAEEAAELRPVVERVFRKRRLPEVWTVRRRVVVDAVSAKPLVFCGIARPSDFAASLRGLGVEAAGLVALRDHARYDEAVVARLVSRARAVGADGFVTTAKDAVKLTPAMRAHLAAVGRLAVADVVVEMVDEARCVASLVGMMES